MTQEDIRQLIETGEKEIIQQIKKVRQTTLKKFLLCCLKGDVEGSPYVTSRRAKHDYKLAIEILCMIDKLQTEVILKAGDSS